MNHAYGYIEEKGLNKYLIIDENKEFLKKYNDVLDLNVYFALVYLYQDCFSKKFFESRY